MQTLNGALTCARYAFAPNLYNYCGPDTGGELGEYLKSEMADEGLVEHLSKFETLYPYFKAIAQANKIGDPLDPRVVEAYWVGNELLEQMSERAIHDALVVKQRLPKRIPQKELKWLLPKIDQRARLHHSFHVFNVFTRTGHHTVNHTVETMDSCRISWGEILQNDKCKMLNDKLNIKSQRLIIKNGKLKLMAAEREVVVMRENLGRKLKVGDWVSVHWGIVCDKLSDIEVKRLSAYTEHHLRLANETL